MIDLLSEPLGADDRVEQVCGDEQAEREKKEVQHGHTRSQTRTKPNIAANAARPSRIIPSINMAVPLCALGRD
jgi:hypothetical protein